MVPCPTNLLKIIRKFDRVKPTVSLHIVLQCNSMHSEENEGFVDDRYFWSVPNNYLVIWCVKLDCKSCVQKTHVLNTICKSTFNVWVRMCLVKYNLARARVFCTLHVGSHNATAERITVYYGRACARCVAIAKKTGIRQNNTSTAILATASSLIF